MQKRKLKRNRYYCLVRDFTEIGLFRIMIVQAYDRIQALEEAENIEGSECQLWIMDKSEWSKLKRIINMGDERRER